MCGTVCEQFFKFHLHILSFFYYSSIFLSSSSTSLISFSLSITASISASFISVTLLKSWTLRLFDVGENRLICCEAVGVLRLNEEGSTRSREDSCLERLRARAACCPSYKFLPFASVFEFEAIVLALSFSC